MCLPSQITYSNSWRLVQCWRPSARALAPSPPMLLPISLHVNKWTKNIVNSSDSMMYVLAWFVSSSSLSAWPRIEKRRVYIQHHWHSLSVITVQSYIKLAKKSYITVLYGVPVTLNWQSTSSVYQGCSRAVPSWYRARTTTTDNTKQIIACTCMFTLVQVASNV